MRKLAPILVAAALLAGCTVPRPPGDAPLRYREVIVLCDLEEISYGEAAAALDCAVGTVRSRLHRARVLLAAKLRGRVAAANASAHRISRCLA